MSLLKVTGFPQVTLLKMMILRTARDFYQPHGTSQWLCGYKSEDEGSDSMCK